MDSNLIIAVAIVVIIILIAVIYVVLQRRQKRKEQMEQAKRVSYLLDRVAEAAKKRKTQLYQSLDEKESSALNALKEISTDLPAGIQLEISEIETKWAKMTEQLAEFSEQSVQSTLQSSVVTTQAAKTAEEIATLVKSAQQKLSSRR